MKNTVTILLSIVIIILVIVVSKIFEYKEEKDQITQFNVKYEEYLNKELYGRDIATVINKATNDNEKNHSKKEDEEYVNVNIIINDLKEETVFNMETIYSGGIAQFVQYYGNIKFKCNEIKYNKSKKVNYILFEQLE